MDLKQVVKNAIKQLEEKLYSDRSISCEFDDEKLQKLRGKREKELFCEFLFNCLKSDFIVCGCSIKPITIQYERGTYVEEYIYHYVFSIDDIACIIEKVEIIGTEWDGPFKAKTIDYYVIDEDEDG